MGITNAKKTEICNKYRPYLEIIDLIGNKVMLQKQLIEFVLLLDIEKHAIDVTKALLNLEHYQIIKKEQFLNTTLKVIVFKKYAIRYLTGAERSKDVGAVPKSQSPERVLLSVFKSHYILNTILPTIESRGVNLSLSKLKNYLTVWGSSILFNKNQGVKFFNKAFKELGDLFSSKALESLEIMKKQEERRQSGLNKGAEATEGKGKGKLNTAVENSLQAVTEAFKIGEGRTHKTKNEKLESFNFDSMLNAFIYVEEIDFKKDEAWESFNGKTYKKVEVQDIIVVKVIAFDLFNRQDLYKIALNISAVYRMLQNYFNKYNLELNYNLACYDQRAKDNLITEANKKGISPRTKEPYEKDRLTELFKLNEVKGRPIKVNFLSYNITNEYLEGTKYLNILKGNGRPQGSKNK